VSVVNRAGIVVFDVNETLSDLASLGRSFADIGAPEWMVQTWFSTVLRDGFALAATGSSATFSVIAEETLRSLLADVTADLDSAVAHLLGGFRELPLHPDVVDGVRGLSASGARLVTLSNGASEVAERLLAAAGIDGHFERMLSVDDAGVWKPAAGAYRYAAQVCGADPATMTLVAAHPWDIDGAKRAGMRTAWINRRNQRYPRHFLAPDHTISTVSELAGLLA
jgi:2-haloacid dehalogenase